MYTEEHTSSPLGPTPPSSPLTPMSPLVPFTPCIKNHHRIAQKHTCIINSHSSTFSPTSPSSPVSPTSPFIPTSPCGTRSVHSHMLGRAAGRSYWISGKSHSSSDTLVSQVTFISIRSYLALNNIPTTQEVSKVEALNYVCVDAGTLFGETTRFY